MTTTTKRDGTVLASEWGVSYTTGSGIDGAILNVHRFEHGSVPVEQRGPLGDLFHHERYDGLTFSSTEAASRFAEMVGLLRPWYRTSCDECGGAYYHRHECSEKGEVASSWSRR